MSTPLLAILLGPLVFFLFGLGVMRTQVDIYVFISFYLTFMDFVHLVLVCMLNAL